MDDVDKYNEKIAYENGDRKAEEIQEFKELSLEDKVEAFSGLIRYADGWHRLMVDKNGKTKVR